jgi:ABC-type phosphate transport system ATPase subunit
MGQGHSRVHPDASPARQQAACVSDARNLMLLGEPIEFGPAQRFISPDDGRLQDYVSGKYS